MRCCWLSWLSWLSWLKFVFSWFDSFLFFTQSFLNSMVRTKQTAQKNPRGAPTYVKRIQPAQVRHVLSKFILTWSKWYDCLSFLIGRRKASATLSARHCSSSRNSAFSEVDRASHPQAALPTTGARDSTGNTSWASFSELCSRLPARSCGGISRCFVRGHYYVCYSRRPRDYSAQGYPTGSANPRGAQLLVIALLFFILQFFEMHTILSTICIEVTKVPI